MWFPTHPLRSLITMWIYGALTRMRMDNWHQRFDCNALDFYLLLLYLVHPVFTTLVQTVHTLLDCSRHFCIYFSSSDYFFVFNLYFVELLSKSVFRTLDLLGVSVCFGRELCLLALLYFLRPWACIKINSIQFLVIRFKRTPAPILIINCFQLYQKAILEIAKGVVILIDLKLVIILLHPIVFKSNLFLFNNILHLCDICWHLFFITNWWSVRWLLPRAVLLFSKSRN